VVPVVGGRLLSRSRTLVVSACAVIAAGVGGCTAAGSNTPTLTGSSLTVYVSDPSSLASDPQAQDVVDAERLAFQQQRSEVTAYHLALVVVSHEKISDNARQAIGDTGHAIAYVGEVLPGDSADSIGITNAEQLLQVSATDTAAELTQKTPAVSGAPQKYYESLSANGRTFARVVPTTVLEAKALITEMQSLGVKSLYVTGDGSEYGRTLADAVRTAASPAISVAASQGTADAVLFAGSSQTEAAQALNTAVSSNPKVKLFAPSALNDDAFVGRLSPAAQKALSVSSPGLLPEQLATAAPSFASGFKTSYGHAPSVEAIFGYEVMSALLHVLQSKGASANDRSKVVKGFFGIRNRSSPLGTYSINQDGDTSIAPFVIERVKAAKLVPVKAVSAG
jgi:branched-chain amino acid transport system substrate-binding protein